MTISAAKSAETVGGCGASGVMSGAVGVVCRPCGALGGAVRAENVGGAEVVPLLVLSAALRSSSAGVGLISSGSAVIRSRKNGAE